MTVRPRKLLTLSIIHDQSRVLLGMKKNGFGAGFWNGFGGKVEKGETIEAAAHREVLEEAGITIPYLEKHGIIEFEFTGAEELLEVHIFRGTKFDGVPVESNEMAPRWFSVNEVPYNEMWPDDRTWLPLLFEGKKFRAKFLFTPYPENKILEQSLSVVSELY